MSSNFASPCLFFLLLLLLPTFCHLQSSGTLFGVAWKDLKPFGADTDTTNEKGTLLAIDPTSGQVVELRQFTFNSTSLNCNRAVNRQTHEYHLVSKDKIYTFDLKNRGDLVSQLELPFPILTANIHKGKLLVISPISNLNFTWEIKYLNPASGDTIKLYQFQTMGMPASCVTYIDDLNDLLITELGYFGSTSFIQVNLTDGTIMHMFPMKTIDTDVDSFGIFKGTIWGCQPANPVDTLHVDTINPTSTQIDVVYTVQREGVDPIFYCSVLDEERGIYYSCGFHFKGNMNDDGTTDIVKVDLQTGKWEPLITSYKFNAIAFDPNIPFDSFK